MNSSKEDLIEMTELTPTKKLPRLKLKKRNQIHSPPFVSPAHSTDRDITSLFSVKKISRKFSVDEDETETISEVSDDLLSESSLRNLTKTENGGSSAKSGHIRSNEKISKLKRSVEKIRRESSQVDANIKSIRNKFQLQEKRAEKPEFSFFSLENENLDDREEELVDDNEELVKYQLPDNLRFNISLAESDSLVLPSRQSFLQNGKSSPLPNPVTFRSIKPDVQIQRGDCIAYHPPNLLTDMLEVVVVKNNILELSLGQLQFFHHPLFSLEHVLQEKLRHVFQKYSRTVEEGNIEKLKEDLRILRAARMSKRDDSARSTEVSVKDIRKLRESLFREGKIQRERLKLILNIWRAIKMLRTNQKYSSTSVRLIIKKEKAQLSIEKEMYDTFFEEILQDILEEHKAAYKRRLKEYNKKLKAKEEVIAIEKSGSDEGGKEESDLEKPVANINRDKIENELKTKFEESFRPPDEPPIVLYLKYDHEVSTDLDNERENDRRKVLSSTKFTVKILCNNIPVCKSKPVSLNNNFMLDINEMFLIQLTNIPKCLSLEIYEHPKGLIKKKIADIKVEIPNAKLLYNQSKYLETNFERREIVHYKHAGVGSGYNINKMMDDNDVVLDLKLDSMEIYTKGTLIHRIGWQSSEMKNTFSNGANVSPAWQISNVINKWGTVHENELRNFLEGKHQNMEELRKFGFDKFLDSTSSPELRHWEADDNQYFRLSPYADKITFSKMIDLQQNIRFQYLKLRDQNEIEFDGIQIPNRIREIPFALLKDFKKRKTLEAIEDDEYDEDPDVLRETGKRRLKQIHTRIFHICKGLNNNLSYESVVDEKYLIYLEEVIKTSLKNFLNWFRWHPKLSRPLPRILKTSAESRKVQCVNQKSQNKILIKILAGKNIPERKIDEKNTIEEVQDVQPFLEISYEDFFTKTSIAVGGNPVWNEIVELPLQYHHADYLNPNALNGSISINLFDHILTYTGINNEDSIEEKCWLGEVKIPLAALTTGLNLSGWFKVVKPSLLFGYQTWEEQHIPKSPKHVIQETSSDETYIQLDLQVSPSIPSLEPNMVDLPSNDVPYIKDHVLKWTDLFNSSFPSKKINALAIDTNGRTNCITRYIRPLEPPQLNNEEFDVTAEQCLRYISLIPFTECNHFYQNVWLTSEQLLNFMIGSVIDHCITLTCFLLALNMDAYLLLGYGIPHGSSSYVLLCEYSRESDIPNYSVLDVVYNEKFILTDPFCPLQKVYCIVNGENVWGNAQRTQNPAFLQFDLTRRSDWWPLFNNNVSAPTNFVNNKINFALGREFEDVERQLERKLKRKFSKWRSMERTNFNHRVSGVLKNGLRFFEMNAMYGRSNTEALLEISKATSQYNVNGTILNMPFTNINAIVKKIKCLNIHIQQQGVTEFGLSVFMQGYPGQVLSVWIFIGTVFDKLS